MAATTAVVRDKPTAELVDLPDKAVQVIAKVSDLLSQGYADMVERAGGRLDKCAAAVLFATRHLVTCKYVPKAHEAFIAARVVIDLLVRVGWDVTDELRADVQALIEDFCDQLRSAKDWKARG